MAASRPEPGPFTKMSSVCTPCSMALRAAVSAAWLAAKGVLLRDPLNPAVPPLLVVRTLPSGSVIVTSVLLNVDCTYAFPRGTFFRSRRRVRTRRLRSATRCDLRLLLRRDASAPGHRPSRPSAGSSICTGPLAMNWQAPAMPQTSIAADLDESLDVEVHF